MARSNISQLLEKLENWDKDERYMGTSDLCNELQKDIKLDASMEQRVCAAVLKRLDDTSNDVQSKAISCIGILLKKVQQGQVHEICDKLCRLILEGSPELRDIYSIGLKTLVVDVPEEYGAGVAQRLLRPLLAGVNSPDEAIKLECLDILADLLKRFGSYPQVSGMHEAATAALLGQLNHERKAVQKRVTACLGAASVVLSDPLLNALVGQLLASTQDGSKVDVCVLVTTIGQISRSVGHRMGRHLDSIVPLFSKFLGDPADEDLHNESHHDLRETCLQGFEALVLSCPREMEAHLPGVTATAVTFMKYDPNYVGDASDDEDGMADDEDEDEDDYDEDDDEGDDGDDDTSWKVRRAAVKVLSSLVGPTASSAAPPSLSNKQQQAAGEGGKGLAAFCASHGPELVKRFSEREEHVRLEVLECFSLLVRTASKKASSSSSSEDEVALALQALLPSVVSAGLKQLGVKGMKTEKTKIAVVNLFKELVVSGPSASGGDGGGDGCGGLVAFLPKLFAHLSTCLAGDAKSSSNALKLECLVLLRTALTSLPLKALQPHLPTILLQPHVLSCVDADWYKIIAEALRVVQGVVVALRPFTSTAATNSTGTNSTMSDEALCGDPRAVLGPLVGPVFAAILPRLEASDMDQEIKECALAAMGALLATWGDLLAPAQVTATMGTFGGKLKNEITRLPALKALQAIAASPLQLDLSPIFASTVQELALFLRQQSRPLKLTTLETLTCLVANPTGAACLAADDKGELVGALLVEVTPLVSDGDLHLTHLALTLTEQVLVASPAAGAPAVGKCVLPSALALSASPLLQGKALQSLQSLLRALVSLSAAGMGFAELYASLRASVDQPSSSSSQGALTKQGVANVAKCLAALLEQCPDATRDATVGELLKDLDGSYGEPRRQLALLTIGEVGQVKDLSATQGLNQLVLASLDCADEASKTAASYALGSMAVGNLQAFLPPLLEALRTDKKKEYLLLASLKEVICSAGSSSKLQPFLDPVLTELLVFTKSPEEGVRNMVAECLGALVALFPETIVQQLRALVVDGSSGGAGGAGGGGGGGGGEEEDESKVAMRWSAAASLKYAMAPVGVASGQTTEAAAAGAQGGGAASSSSSSSSSSASPASSLAVLSGHMDFFLALLQDEDLTVVHACLQMCNAAVHHQPSLVAPFLEGTIGPALSARVTFKQLRKVDLGPFKQTVDDGLPLRKAALATVSTVLDAMPERFDVASFVEPLKSGLEDEKDTAMLSHQILAKVCGNPLFTACVLGCLDALVAPLLASVKKTKALMDKKLKEGQAGGTEVERLNDYVRSCVRAFLAVDAIATEDAVTSSAQFKGLKELVDATESLRAMACAIKAEA